MRIKSPIIGQLIRQARLASNLSQSDLAVKIGLSVKAVSAYEVGRVFPTVYTLKKIADITKFPVDYFFGDAAEVEAIEMSVRLRKVETEVEAIKKWLVQQAQKQSGDKSTTSST